MHAGRRLHRRLDALRRRTRAGIVLWAGVAALTAGLTAFALAAFVLGRTSGTAWIVAAWSTVTLAMMAAALPSLRRALALRGPGVASVLRRRDERVAMRVRSALELEPATSGESATLIEAHVRATARDLESLPAPRRWPPGRGARRRVLVTTSACLAGAALLTLNGRAAQGTFGLLHPHARSQDGGAVSVVFDRLQLHVAYPQYMSRAPIDVEAGGSLELPIGCTVTVTASGTVRAARMIAADASVPLAADGAGRFSGRFVTRRPGTIRVKATDDGREWVEDARVTRLEMQADRAPVLALLAPTDDATLDDEEVALQVEAHDDFGVSEIRACARAASSEPSCRRIWTFPAAGPAQPQTRSVRVEQTLSLRDLHATPGDALELWIEASDADDVSGPHVTRTEPRRLSLASPHTDRQRWITALRVRRGALVDALADHLTGALEAEQVRQRGERLAELADDLARDAAEDALGRSVLTAIASSLGALGRGEATSRGTGLRRAAGRATTGLERATLDLDRLVSRASLRDAEALAQEVLELQRQMSALLAAMRGGASDAQRRELAALVARARSRLAELRAELARSAGPGTDEFLNASREHMETRGDALLALLDAVDQGDVDSAREHLAELSAELEALAHGLSGGAEQFGAGAFGPRQAALAEARARLVALEGEQRAVAGDTERLRRNAAERALAGAAQASVGPGLEAASRAARAALERVPAAALSAGSARRRATALARLRDVTDALGARDLAGARDMARAALSSTEELTRDLELAELIDEDRARSAAGPSQEAERQVRQLRRAIDDAIPDLRAHLDRGLTQDLADVQRRQTHASAAATALADRFEAEPDGRPLSARASATVDEAARSMRQAADALGRGDPIAAGDASNQAASQLTQLRRELDQERSARQRPRGASRAERVRIHGRDEAGPRSARRARALAGLREETPPGYEAPLRSYYEGLLR